MTRVLHTRTAAAAAALGAGAPVLGVSGPAHAATGTDVRGSRPGRLPRSEPGSRAVTGEHTTTITTEHPRARARFE